MYNSTFAFADDSATEHVTAMIRLKPYTLKQSLSLDSDAGQGLGASGQGMASALEASGQKHRAGLGFASQGSQPTAPPESYAPAPDAQVYIDNAQPVSSSEAGAWDVVLQVQF